MALYTRTGDDGTTARPGGNRISKAEAIVEAGGAVEELNAHLGLCLVQTRADGLGDVTGALEAAQDDLFAVGAILAVEGTGRPAPVTLDDAPVERMEQTLDEINASLPPLTTFILPGGTELASRLHVARTVCRRAERQAVAAGAPPVVVRHLNRLGDLLFALARRANAAAGREDQPWPR